MGQFAPFGGGQEAVARHLALLPELFQPGGSLVARHGAKRDADPAIRQWKGHDVGELRAPAFGTGMGGVAAALGLDADHHILGLRCRDEGKRQSRSNDECKAPHGHVPLIDPAPPSA